MVAKCFTIVGECVCAEVGSAEFKTPLRNPGYAPAELAT